MPVDYQHGKIYSLYIDDMFYIGSTAQPRLSIRFGKHKSGYKMWVKNGKNYCSSWELFKVGIPTIELIELFPCLSKKELKFREGYYQQLNPDCVNKMIEGRTKESARQHNNTQKKDYYKNNRTRISEEKRQRYIRNKRTAMLTLFVQSHIQVIAATNTILY